MLENKFRTQNDMLNFTHNSYMTSTTYKTPYFYMVKYGKENSNVQLEFFIVSDNEAIQQLTDTSFEEIEALRQRY